MVTSSNQSSNTTQQMTDPEAARRMAAVSESAERRSQDQYNLGKTLYEPYEREMVAANMSLIDPNRRLVEAQMGEEAKLTPLRGDVAAAGMQDTLTDIESTRGLKDQMIANQTADMKASAGVGEAFFKESMDGVDPTQRMGEAQTDVAQGFAKSQATLERDLNRSGVGLTDEKNTAMQTNLAIERAKAVGGARTGAYRGAEAENFARLTTAMQAKGNYQLPGVASTATTATGALPVSSGAIQLGGYQLQSGIDKSTAFTGAAIQANQAGMNPLTQSSSKGSSWGFLSSSKDVKNRINELGVDTNKIHALNPVSFFYNDGDVEQFGFIAEEMYGALPQIVVRDPQGKIVGYRPDSLLCILTAEVQSIKKESDKKVAELQKMVSELTNTIEQMGKRRTE